MRAYPGTAFPLFGDRLRTARERSGLSVGACAQKCGVTEAAWRRWERGAGVPYSTDEGRTIADTVRADVAWLYGMTDVARAWPPRCY